MQMAKKAKRTVKDRTNAVSDENTVGQVAVKKSPTRPKKGIAVKKTPLKKTQSKWTGYVETDSEDEDENSEDTKLVQRASIVAKTNRTKIRTSKAQGRVTKSRAVHKTSTTATGVSRRVRSDVLKDVEESSRSMPKTLRRVGLRARTTARRLLKS